MPIINQVLPLNFSAWVCFWASIKLAPTGTLNKKRRERNTPRYIHVTEGPITSPGGLNKEAWSAQSCHTTPSSE